MSKLISSAFAATVVISCAGSGQAPSIAPIVPMIVDAGCSEASCDVQKVEVETKDEVKAEDAKGVNGSHCPAGMIFISGNFCPKDDALCLYWVDAHGKRTTVNTDRCGEWRSPVHCIVSSVKKSYCIDKFEFPNKKGVLPRDWLSFVQAQQLAAAEGKRLCTQSEWTFAALGPDNHPIPYGDGFHRSHACNIDRHIADVSLIGDQVMKVSNPDSDVAQKLRSQLVPSGSMEDCKSDFGVYDMVGNIDEWVINESGKPYVSGLMSGHQYGIRNRSRAITTAHGPSFSWYETGFRACLNSRDQ